MMEGRTCDPWMRRFMWQRRRATSLAFLCRRRSASLAHLRQSRPETIRYKESETFLNSLIFICWVLCWGALLGWPLQFSTAL